ncbi:hypothetical protein EDD37DRAFT_82276 [Exophiala viscosa]|uniref:uncharacterized protein n=1 Tax=Exophiala viscosa TaxID=2486360 RepID=UPI00219EC463|nr:hypothetical protein EDD37DRAFT_82276 [Exophiala viscosa]
MISVYLARVLSLSRGCSGLLWSIVLREVLSVSMKSSFQRLSLRTPFSCIYPSKQDDYGNCVDFQNQKWVLHGPKTLLMTSFVVSIIGGCCIFVLMGRGSRAKKNNSTHGAIEWFKGHSMAGAMALALIYFLVNAYLQFIQYEQRTEPIASMLIDFARTKPQGLGDYIVLTVILRNKHIYAVSGAASETYFKVWGWIFYILFTVSDLASAIGDLYTRTNLVIEIGNKGVETSYSKIIPSYVDSILSAFDTVAYALIVLAGVYFVTVAFKFKLTGRDKTYKRYLYFYTVASVAFLIRSIPGLVFCIISDWFSWTRTYRMNLLDSMVYAVTTVTIFTAWTELARTPINAHSPGEDFRHSPLPHVEEYKQANTQWSSVNL